MKWEQVLSILSLLFGASGVGTGLVFWRKYQAEVGRTDADTGKISAETINALLTGVRDATAGFNEQMRKLRSEWEAEREQWRTERERWTAERDVERAVWREKETRWERERAELRLAIQSGSTERATIKDALNAIKLQVSVFENLPEQIRLLQVAVDRWENSGPPSKDPVIEHDGE